MRTDSGSDPCASARPSLSQLWFRRLGMQAYYLGVRPYKLRPLAFVYRPLLDHLHVPPLTVVRKRRQLLSAPESKCERCSECFLNGSVAILDVVSRPLQSRPKEEGGMQLCSGCMMFQQSYDVSLFSFLAIQLYGSDMKDSRTKERPYRILRPAKY